MAVSFVARKCTQCAGKLEYIKEKKLWRCLYCGAEIERQEQYDGLFTIKNVVRQSLLDTAYRRLDSAAKNLIECEKIDSRYVGTLIAKLAYDMIRVITPGACDPRDARSIFTQLKKTYEQLRAISTGVSDDEEALYEFLEESDIFATLILVYDALNDTARRDHVAQLLDAGDVFSKPANNNLLTYALKTGKTDLADKVIANVDNIDPKAALSEVMNKYPDSAEKGQRMTALLATGAIRYEDKKLVEGYLTGSGDSVETKCAAAVAAMDKGIPVGTDVLMDSVVRRGDAETVKKALTAFCRTRIGDDDVVRILDFAYGCGDRTTAENALDCLKNSGHYVLVPAKLLIGMLAGSAFGAEDKIALVNKSFAFKVDAKSAESVLTNYLCYNGASPEEREKVMACLLDKVGTVPTATVENYVLKCRLDGEKKAAMVKTLFDKGLKISFFNSLLSKYMNGSQDDRAVKTAVVEVLSGLGLKIEPGAFVDYICDSADELPVKLQFVRRMAANGSQLRADAANAYLERTAPERFSPELFSMVCTPGSSFSGRAVENYVLRCRDRDAVRADNVRALIERASSDVTSASCRISHLGNAVTCNLLQAYVLTTSDAAETAVRVADYLMSARKLKINAEMSVSGTSMKLKKYVVANRASLSAVTNALCEKYKVYSMLF